MGGAGSGDAPTAYIVNDTHIQLGAFSISDLSVIYAPTSALPFDSIDETYFDGVLGADFFNCCLIEINHDTKTLVITKPDNNSVAHYRNGQWQELAMPVEGNTPYFITSLHDKEKQSSVKLMLDTGSTGTLSLFAGSHRFALPDKTYAATTTGIQGDSANHVGLLNHFTLGNTTFEDLPTYFRFEGSNSQDGSDGVLGNQVLQRFNIVFDFSGERLWYQPAQHVDAYLGADRSGLRLLPPPQGAIVKQVAPNTGAALANVEVNSIVTKIDGNPVTYKNFDTLKLTLSDPKRNTVSLCWTKEEHVQCKMLMLEARI